MNCCCFRVAKPPASPINAGRILSSHLPARPTAFASRSLLPLRTRAFPGDCLALLEVSANAVSTARTPDPAVLLQTSVLLLSLYIVTNFVVPSYVSKSLGVDKAGDEDSNPLDEDSNPLDEDKRSNS